MTGAQGQESESAAAGHVVVTGVAGTIGAAVARQLIRSGTVVTGIDRQEPDEDLRRALGGFVRCDLSVSAQAARAFAGRGVDAVAHLAAIPAPVGDPAAVFASNTAATYNVLHQAGRAGARAMLLASSISALGMVYAPVPFSPCYVPVDERHPARPADPYGLSKIADEQTGAMMARLYRVPVLAYRFPYTGTAGMIAERAATLRADPAPGARELWAYLDVRDAAEACVTGIGKALAGEVTGCHVLNIVASDALVDGPLDNLIRRFHPTTEIIMPLGARTSAYDTADARRVLAFQATWQRK